MRKDGRDISKKNGSYNSRVRWWYKAICWMQYFTVKIFWKSFIIFLQLHNYALLYAIVTHKNVDNIVLCDMPKCKKKRCEYYYTK